MNSGKTALNKGLFITFEGIDQSGKSTQVERLMNHLREEQIPAELWRDPGSTLISEQIRDILLSSRHHAMDPVTELLLYEAARTQVVAENIRPALKEKKIVIMDRFYDSTTAYQGYGRGIDLKMIHQANQIATGGLKPDITFYIDIEWEESNRRKGKEAKDRMESESRHFFDRVRKGYLSLVKCEPERFILIDGSMSKSIIEKQIQDHIRSLMIVE